MSWRLWGLHSLWSVWGGRSRGRGQLLRRLCHARSGVCGPVWSSEEVCIGLGMKNVNCRLICSFFTRQTRGLEGGRKKPPCFSVVNSSLFLIVIMQRCKSQLAAIHLHGLPLPAELEVSCFLMVFEIISERMSLWRIAKLIQKSCGKSFLSAWLAPAVLKYLPAGFGEKLTIIVPMDVSRLLKGCSFTWEQCVCVCARGREFTVNWWISECVNILYYMTV